MERTALDALIALYEHFKADNSNANGRKVIVNSLRTALSEAIKEYYGLQGRDIVSTGYPVSLDSIKQMMDLYDELRNGNPQISNGLITALMAAFGEFLSPFRADEMTPEEHEQARRPNGQGKIPAIKMIRERTGLGLKEAKDLYERFYPNR